VPRARHGARGKVSLPSRPRGLGDGFEIVTDCGVQSSAAADAGFVSAIMGQDVGRGGAAILNCEIAPGDALTAAIVSSEIGIAAAVAAIQRRQIPAVRAIGQRRAMRLGTRSLTVV